MEVHERIKAKRKELKISQEKISFDLGIDQSGYSKIERGTKKAADGLLARIFEYLGIKG